MTLGNSNLWRIEGNRGKRLNDYSVLLNPHNGLTSGYGKNGILSGFIVDSVSHFNLTLPNPRYDRITAEGNLRQPPC